MNPARSLNYTWRLVATALCFAVFGIGGVLAPLIATPVLRLLPGGALVRQRRARQLIHRLFRGFIHLMRALGVMSWRTEGLEKLRREGLLVLANHPTLIDVVFLVAFIPNANCIVKSRLLNNPAMRGLISLAGYITNDHGDELLAQATRSFAEGDVLMIFPEGTRTRAGAPISFQRGAANIAIRCDVAITPVVIVCSPPTLSKEHKWYHIPERPFLMSFEIKDDIAITPFLDCPASLGSRRLTHHLEQFFTEAHFSARNNAAMGTESLHTELKVLLIETLDLEDISPDDIDDAAPLFNEGLGLDSIDALEIGVALQKQYGIKLDPESDEIKQHFASIADLARLVADRGQPRGAPA